MPNTELQKYKYFSALATPALNYFTVSKLKSNFKSRAALGGASFCRLNRCKNEEPPLPGGRGGNGDGRGNWKTKAKHCSMSGFSFGGS